MAKRKKRGKRPPPDRQPGAAPGASSGASPGDGPDDGPDDGTGDGPREGTNDGTGGSAGDAPPERAPAPADPAPSAPETATSPLAPALAAGATTPVGTPAPRAVDLAAGPGDDAALLEPPEPGGVLEGLRLEFAQPAAAAILLGCLAVICYANSFQIPFLFDDAPVVTRNRLLWRWEDAWELMRSLPTRSLTNLTFLLNFQLGGTSTVQSYGPWDYGPYHAVSIALHAANGVLLYLLVRDLLRARPGEVPPGTVPWVALLGAAVWVAHPAQTMAVAYIAQRYALMAGLAFLGTLVCYVRWRHAVEAGASRTWPWLAGAVAAAVCCGLTKENAAVVPLAVVGVEALFFRGRRLGVALGFVALFAVPGALRLSQTGLDGFFPASSPSSDRWGYFMTQVVVTLRYLHLWLMPHDLCVEQSFPILWDTKRLDFALAGYGRLWALALLGHGLLWALALKLLLRGHRLIPAAVGWYYLTHLVESSFIPILDPMVDHRMYLPTALLAPALAVALARAWPAIEARWPRGRDLVVAPALALVLACGVGTFLRNRVWASSTGIWEDTIEKRPDCARAYSSLGMEHLYAGEWLRAIEPIEVALLLGPYHVEGWNNLGKAYLELRQWRSAEAALRRGIEVHRVAPSPSVPLCWNNLGLVYFNLALEATDPDTRRKELERAAAHLAEAARLDPLYEVAWVNLGNARFRLLDLSEGEARREHAAGCVHAIDQADAIARRRGDALSVELFRKRALARAEAGDPIGAYQQVEQLVAALGAKDPVLTDDLGRLALAAADARDAARARAATGPVGPVFGPSPGAPAGAPPSDPGGPDPAEVERTLRRAAATLEEAERATPGRLVTAALRVRVAARLGDRAAADAVVAAFEAAPTVDPNEAAALRLERDRAFR